MRNILQIGELRVFNELLNLTSIRMKNQLYILLAFLFLSFTMGCGGGGEQAADEPTGTTIGITDSTITVGSWGPLSGPAALWGTITKGMAAYFDLINEEGGINGRKINFIYKDDAYDPSKTVPIVRELVQKEEVFAMVGGIGTAPCMSVVDYLVEENIPWVSPITGATHWSIPLKQNVFGALPYYFDEGEIQAKYAIDSLQATKIGIIYQNDDVGKSGMIGAQNYFDQKGVEFVAAVPVEVTDTDLSSHVAKLKDSGADVVLLWTLPRQAAITLGTAAAANFKPQWIASFILADMPLMYDITKGAWEGVIFGFFGSNIYTMENPRLDDYKAALEKYQEGVRWGIFSYSGFAYAEPFVEALKRAGRDVTRESLIEALESMNNWTGGTVGEISFSAEDHQALRSMFLAKCKSATEMEVLTDYMTGESDINALIAKLHGE